MRKKGFVLIETIVVITVLCVVLITLYSSYYRLLISLRKKSLYDNTEYIYKTTLVRKVLEKELENNASINRSDYESKAYYTYCRNQKENKCYTESNTGNYINDLFKNLKVEAVYITIWDTKGIGDISEMEPTTQSYIKKLDTTNEDGFRIVVMYQSENNDSELDVYEYASLIFGSRR